MASQQISITIHATDGTDDYTLSCNVEWSISRLKEVIQELHPSKPAISNQKLLYQEQELKDNLVIGTLLKVSDTIHVIKLVLKKQETTTATEQTNTAFMEGTGLRHRNVGGSTLLPSNNPWLQWQQSQMAAYYQQQSYAQLPTGHENYAAMLQQYNDYMNYYNSISQHQNGAQPSSVTQTDGAIPPPPAPADPPPAQGNPPDANPPMNAQGGLVAADNDDLAANDWLDILFALFRYAFFASIILFYSNFWRFLLVASLFFLLYIYQSGIFRAQRRAPHPDEVQRRENERRGGQNREEQQENTDDNNNDNSINENAENETEEQAVPPPPSIFATAWCFVTTFFSSLIPQPPPVV